MTATKRLQNLCIATFQAREMPTQYLPWELLHAPNPLQSHLLSSLPRSKICDRESERKQSIDFRFYILDFRLKNRRINDRFVRR